MSKIAQSKNELIKHLHEQLSFIVSSCKAYDSGETQEAKRIAVSIRILLHDTQTSHSLFSQLKIKTMGFLSSSLDQIPNPKEVFLGLLQTKITVSDSLTLSGKHHPLLFYRPKDWPRAKKRFFAEWWNQIVLSDALGARFSRRSLVMAVANTDGGAHVDSKLDSDYAMLSRHNSIRFAVGNDLHLQQIDKSELASIRQIAHEIIVSLRDRHPDLIPLNLNYEPIS